MNQIRTIVIDPGHGGANEGTTQNGFLEKEMTLITANALYEELSAYDELTVYMTRTTDTDMSLADRAAFAASVNADMLISVHYNATLDGDKYGSEIWIPIDTPNHMVGYRFGEVYLKKMEEMGLFIRGIKTRESEEHPGLNYYGIIRAGEENGIPTVILEHCHVDEARDAVFCDTDAKLEEFGRADAQAILEFVGLKESDDIFDSFSYNDNLFVTHTGYDTTPPDVCEISVQEADYEAGKLEIIVSAMDAESPLVYFDYSLNGGITYGELKPWPNTDPVHNVYADSFTLTIPVNVASPKVCIRAYNMYDVKVQSNVLSDFPEHFVVKSETVENEESNQNTEQSMEANPTPVPTKAPGQMLGGESDFLTVTMTQNTFSNLNPKIQGFLLLSIGLTVCIIITSVFVLLRARLHKKGKKKRK